MTNSSNELDENSVMINNKKVEKGIQRFITLYTNWLLILIGLIMHTKFLDYHKQPFLKVGDIFREVGYISN